MNSNAGVAELDNEGLFDLLGSYQNIYKPRHLKNTTELFDSLVEKSKVDIPANQETNRKIKDAHSQIGQLAKRIRKRTAVKVLLILAIIAAVAAIASQIYVMTQTGPEVLPLSIVFAGAALIVLFIALIKKMGRLTKELKSAKGELEAAARKLEDEAWEQMRSLNALFTSKMSQELLSKTLPMINFDRIFDRKRLDYFVGKFGLMDAQDDTSRSALFVQSGDIGGNPFFICNDLVHELGTKVYTGSIVIHWTTTEVQDGKTVTVHHTETLTASVTKPCPYYKELPYLVYGSEAAPDLIFSRRDSDAENMNQKQIDKQVNKKIKKLNKKAEKSVTSGGGFTVLGNSEFEVLFGATNRNNEVQFRLLFTPLAQKQLLQIMKEKEIGFGDDFGFSKYRMLNYIYPEHLRNIKLNISPEFYHGYDFDEVKAKFLSYHENYLRHIYFTFAPILAIPLYQQQKPQEYIYRDLYDSCASFYEHEFVANNMNPALFAHPESDTPNILKTAVVGSDGSCDTVQVTAYGYHTEPRVDYVNKLGGDGRIHTIPVHWTEYIPVAQTTELVTAPIPAEEELTPAEHFRQALENLAAQKKMDPKDVYTAGLFLAYILRQK